VKAQHPRELPQSLHEVKVAIKLVFTTYVTYLKAHMTQKLLSTPLTRPIVTENTDKKIIIHTSYTGNSDRKY